MRTHFAMLIMVAVLSASVVTAQDGAEETKAIQKIELLGGKLERIDDRLSGPIVGVSFKENNRFNQKYLSLLKSLASLKSLDLFNVAITDDGLKEICKLTNLTVLSLGGGKITDGGIGELRELKNLTELTLCETGVTPTAIADLRQSLPDLRIYDDFTAIKTVEQLGGKIDRAGQKGAQVINQIYFNDEVATVQFNVGDVTLQANRQGTPEKLTDADLQELRGLGGVASLSSIVFVGCTQITDAGIQETVRIKNLKVLQLVDCPKITGEGLRAFQDHDSLTEIRLQGCKRISDVGLTEVGKLKNLTAINLGDTSITDEQLKGLQGLHNLTELSFSNNSRITGSALKGFESSSHLTSLTLQWCREFTDDDLRELAELTQLKHLGLVGARITDVGMQEFERLPNLETLDLSASRISDAGLLELRALKNLKSLHVFGCKQITEAGCNELNKSLPDLKIARQ